VCRAPQKYPDTTLQTAAVLALCKMMSISASFCESNLQLLFTVRQLSSLLLNFC
jgi:condensin complex subunit 1